MNAFSILIQELGNILGSPLQAENDIACKILMKDRLSLQIEYDEPTQQILIVAFITKISSGAFLEDVLKAALQYNHTDHSLGAFSYLPSSQYLVLQSQQPLSITAPLLSALLQQIFNTSCQWKDAIEEGNISHLCASSSHNKVSPLNLS